MSGSTVTLTFIPLRSLTYVDLETLLAHAEYADIDVPRASEVVERAVRTGSLTASAGIGSVQLGGGKSKDIEYQRTYSLEPKNNAVVSKVIDALFDGHHAVTAEEDTVLLKDQLIELTGHNHLTPASMAGKVLHIALQVANGSDQDISNLTFDQSNPDLLEQLKRVYLANEVLPVPILLEMAKSPLGCRVFINLSPNHFVDAAGVDRVEGEVTILGTVSTLIDAGKAITAERWLLDGYEWTMRRIMMTNIEDRIDELVSALGLTFPDTDIRHIVEGPAVIIDAIAVY